MRRTRIDPITFAVVGVAGGVIVHGIWQVNLLGAALIGTLVGLVLATEQI